MMRVYVPICSDDALKKIVRSKRKIILCTTDLEIGNTSVEEITSIDAESIVKNAKTIIFYKDKIIMLQCYTEVQDPYNIERNGSVYSLLMSS